MDGTAGDPATILQWANAFQNATGMPLAFMNADAAWHDDMGINNFGVIEQEMHNKGILFGIIYDADSQENTDTGWTQSAIDHFTQVESGFDMYPDLSVFSSWAVNPTYTLPETTPGATTTTGTLMNVAFQYVLPRTYLSMSNFSGSFLNIHLIDSKSAPIAGANITVNSIDIANTGGLTPRSMSGTTPATTAYAIIGIRGNTEGATMDYASGEADLGTITVQYQNASSTASTWSYTTPSKIVMTAATPTTPAQTVTENLYSGGSENCNGNSVIPIAPNSPYTLNVPMSATGSANHAGYVTLIYLDSSCHSISRDYLYFSPSTQTLNISPSVTDSSGDILLNMPPNSWPTGAELRAYYNGDNATHRSSMVITETSAPQS